MLKLDWKCFFQHEFTFLCQKSSKNKRNREIFKLFDLFHYSRFTENRHFYLRKSITKNWNHGFKTDSSDHFDINLSKNIEIIKIVRLTFVRKIIFPSRNFTQFKSWKCRYFEDKILIEFIFKTCRNQEIRMLSSLF